MPLFLPSGSYNWIGVSFRHPPLKDRVEVQIQSRWPLLNPAQHKVFCRPIRSSLGQQRSFTKPAQFGSLSCSDQTASSELMGPEPSASKFFQDKAGPIIPWTAPHPPPKRCRKGGLVGISQGKSDLRDANTVFQIRLS